VTEPTDPLDRMRDPAQVEEGQPAALPPRSLRKPILIGALFIGAGLWLVLALLPGILSRDAVVPGAPAQPDAAASRRIQVTLFYVSDDGAELVPVVREVPFGATTADQAREIAIAQVRPPDDGSVSAIPKGTTVRSVFVGSQRELYVDLSTDIVKGHGGGTQNEALAVFAIVNAITSNLPDIIAVQILVEGKEVDSLAGHLDLREPIGRATDWIRKGQ
jgi:spore germination protein GerM